tara:strand:+ start:492 stop:3311 length:2820 start_codon:yes stop_codon:yes gene_type:complete
MAGFAPQLNGGVGFVQAQGGDAGGLGVLSSLSGMLPSGSKTAARAPSEDERNAALWQEMYPDQDIAEASMGQLRSFGKRNPSAADWGVSTAEATLNQNVADFTAATESERTITTKLQEDWATSPEGVVAQNAATSIQDEGQRIAFLATSHADWMGRKVQAQQLTEETQQYGVNAKRRDEMWTLEGFNMKGGADTVATAMTDAVESMMLNPSATINLDDTGITAAIPELAGTVLTRDNSAMVMETFRSSYMDSQTRRIAGAYGISAGELGQMPDAVKNQVFGKFDSTLTWLTNEVDPAQIKKRLDNEAYLGMIEAGVPLDKINAISLAAKGNPELTAAITASMVGDVGAVMQGFENGDFDAALQTAKNLSKAERHRSFAGFSELAKVWGGTSSAGDVYAEVPEAMRGVGFSSATMAAFTVAQVEAGDSGLVLGNTWYKQNVESQGQAYAHAAKHDPNFEPTMVKNLSSDLSVNMEMLRTEASKQGYVPVMENGNIVLAHGGPTHTQKMAAFDDAIARATANDLAAVPGIVKNRDDYLNYTPKAINLEVDGDNVDALGLAVYKFNALKNLGDIGSQVRDLTTADFNLVDAEAEAVAADAMKALSDQAIIDAGGTITTELDGTSVDPINTEEFVAQMSGQTATDLISTAESVLGFDEVKQKDTLTNFLSEGGVDIDPSQTAWCAAFVNATLSKTGLDGTRVLNARSFLDWGSEVTEPQLGDVVVLYRGNPDGWQGHVGFFKGFDENGDILILGGNQGDSVSVSSYDKDRLLGYRRPDGVTGGGTEAGLSQAVYKSATDPTFLPATPSDVAPEATTSPGVQPSAPASEAGAFVQTPTGEGENLRTDRTGGEAFRASAARQDVAVNEGISDSLRSIASNASALHGEGSTTTNKINALIKTVDGGGKVKASDVTKLIDETKALPRTPERQELLADLYEMRDGAAE